MGGAERQMAYCYNKWECPLSGWKMHVHVCCLSIWNVYGATAELPVKTPRQCLTCVVEDAGLCTSRGFTLLLQPFGTPDALSTSVLIKPLYMQSKLSIKLI